MLKLFKKIVMQFQKSPYTIYVLIFVLISGSNCQQHKPAEVDKPLIDKEMLIKASEFLVSKDAEIIASYAKRRGWNVSTSATGLFYEIFFRGRGVKAKEGDIVKLKYQVSLLDGRLCYSSDSLGLKEFMIGKSSIEAGLDEGVRLLHQGDKARFILPPHLAFGLVGDQKMIPRRATIVYEVTLNKVITPHD